MVGETSYRFLADITAQLRAGSADRLRDVAGTVSATTQSAATLAATGVAETEATNRLGLAPSALGGLSVNLLDLYA